MKVRLHILDTGTRVRIRQPRASERGIWVVRGRVVGSGLDDPAYDLDHERTGRPASCAALGYGWSVPPRPPGK
jgi:hypothetical protein